MLLIVSSIFSMDQGLYVLKTSLCFFKWQNLLFIWQLNFLKMNLSFFHFLQQSLSFPCYEYFPVRCFEKPLQNQFGKLCLLQEIHSFSKKHFCFYPISFHLGKMMLEFKNFFQMHEKCSIFLHYPYNLKSCVMKENFERNYLVCLL